MGKNRENTQTKRSIINSEVVRQYSLKVRDVGSPIRRWEQFLCKIVTVNSPMPRNVQEEELLTIPRPVTDGAA